jgi:hypothetical protein
MHLMAFVRSTASAVAILSLTGALGCAKQPRQRAVEGGPVAAGAGTTRAARDYLEGRWSLLSFTVMPPGREPIEVSGAGTLVYDAYANLRMEIRVDEAAGARLAAAGMPIAGGVLSTDGRVAVDLSRQVLTYVLDEQARLGAPAGPLAPTRPRYWQVEDGVLTLTTKDEQGNVLSVGRWQKQP